MLHGNQFLFCTFIVVVLVLGCVRCGVIEDNETSDSSEIYFGVRLYPTERHCAMVGGVCVKKEDCAEGTSKQGLCPKSRSLGVECCYAVHPRPAPCQQFLGACMSSCHASLIRNEATDCPSDTKCCVLV